MAPSTGRSPRAPRNPHHRRFRWLRHQFRRRTKVATRRPRAHQRNQLDDLRAKTHRGLTGQIERGYHAGGLSYGYRSVVAGVNARGEPIGHRLEIDDAQAAIVREIFARYGEGESCQRIAANLNARGVRGPRGGTWCVSALYGSPAKRAGVLNNELYVGRYVWNRSKWIKNLDTGKRERFIRPESEWQSVARPELCILDDELWHAVRERMASPRRPTRSRRRADDPARRRHALRLLRRVRGEDQRTHIWMRRSQGPRASGMRRCGGELPRRRSRRRWIRSWRAGRAQVHALVTGLDVALRTDVARARDALRAMLGDVQLIEESGAVYAECDNAAERLLLAVGGVSMGRVAGARNPTQKRRIRVR